MTVADDLDALRRFYSGVPPARRVMRWRRDRPGVYRCGLYVVERTAGGWCADGPGVGGVFGRRVEAWAACDRADAAATG